MGVGDKGVSGDNANVASTSEVVASFGQREGDVELGDQCCGRKDFNADEARQKSRNDVVPVPACRVAFGIG